MINSFIRNFCIISHIDHGKSTLADRFLELTNTIPESKMRAQFLDKMELEREKGITIKMQPIRMLYHPDRRSIADVTQKNAEDDFLYEDLTYKIRGILFQIRKKIGLGHKEQVYHNAFEIELKKEGIKFESKKNIQILYERKSIGVYQPDFVVDEKVIIEFKALPEIGKPQIKQIWSYLKGCSYKLALLVNFGSKDLEIKRFIYDKARLLHDSAFNQRDSAQVENIILNLIDTPGHVDFSYEVSRALAACEGAILLVDAQKGIQAQTLANLDAARKNNLVIIPAINKIDLSGAEPEIVAKQISRLLDIDPKEILFISAKTGEGVEKLLEKIIRDIPAPIEGGERAQALIFDAIFDEFRGVISYVRVFGGELRYGDKVKFLSTNHEAKVEELGYFGYKLEKSSKLASGEIGYIICGLKDISWSKIGDTLAIADEKGNYPKALLGYQEPQAKVFASFYCIDGEEFSKLKRALDKLKLNDSSLVFEPETSLSFGYGFRCGFLGLLHMEITKERLEREFDLDLVVTSPSVTYKFIDKQGKEKILKNPALLPQDIKEIKEPWIKMEIITPSEYLGALMKLIQNYRSRYINTEYLEGNKVILTYEFPLSEIITDFYDKLKSISSGFASMNYKIMDWRSEDLVKLEIDIAEKPIDAFSQIVHKDQAQRMGRRLAEKLKNLIPRQLFEVRIQARIGSRIIASEKIPALRKDVIAKLYGGDRTRKDKLLKKQALGKKKMKRLGKVDIPKDLFLKFYKS